VRIDPEQSARAEQQAVAVGRAWATISPAVLPFDPGRFSTTTGCPSRPASGSPIARATMSAAPPGG
jgi:hypothetical protein